MALCGSVWRSLASAQTNKTNRSQQVPTSHAAGMQVLAQIVPIFAGWQYAPRGEYRTLHSPSEISHCFVVSRHHNIILEPRQASVRGLSREDTKYDGLLSRRTKDEHISLFSCFSDCRCRSCCVEFNLVISFASATRPEPSSAKPGPFRLFVTATQPFVLVGPMLVFLTVSFQCSAPIYLCFIDTKSLSCPC